MVRSPSVFIFVLSESFLTRIGAGRVADQFPQDVEVLLSNGIVESRAGLLSSFRNHPLMLDFWIDIFGAKA